MAAPTTATTTGTTGQFRRTVGTVGATAINMTQMCGIGPFVTIPLMVATMGGPQAILGWVVGALLALTDGLVWAELGAAMPGAGGTYLYLREAFQYRTGRLMPFLFVWTAMISIPLIMSTGVIGLVQYLGFFFPDMSWLAVHAIGVGVVALVMLALFRRIESIRVITTALWVVMLVTVVLTIAACYSHFSPDLAFDFPAGAFHLDGGFFTGLGAGLLIAVYDYLGYNTTAYMGDELKDPGRSMPRSIVFSILAMMVIYLTLNVGVMGAVPWRQVAESDSVASLAVTTNWGHTAAAVVTVLIIITAFGSVFAGLLGGSRVPYNAARDRVFFPVFARLAPKGGFPYVALAFMGVVTALGSLLDLSTVINMLTTVAVLVQSVAQVVALTVLRRRQPGLRRPYRQWLYPVPSLIALVGWVYVYFSATTLSILLSLGWIVVGVVAFLVWARVRRSWPFAPVEVHEAYLEAQERGATTPGGDPAQPSAVTA
ncbi:Amino acid transporter [Microlunatus sagamiharensis]|uniref:Amino acid transporter n=1 Tax=Microlunatus sagamiharensis TaxID=546874 RepID=A0A1H2MQI5_9ACTN|nr:APC family permease [Microlunatus sagamiharensis]SDU95258.1 Amino acid transporter [Microlunatus sagamiharensis]